MSFNNNKNCVRTTFEAFNYYSAALWHNHTISELRRDYDAMERIVKYFAHDLGQKHLVNLAHKYSDSAVSLAFYAGNGIVTKVNVAERNAKAASPHLLPPITTHQIQGKHREFDITTYPYVRPGLVSDVNIDELKVTLGRFGVGIIDGDDDPRNFHRLPDRNETIVSIDSDVYKTVSFDNVALQRELGKYWEEYLAQVYPIYNGAQIERQDENTEFSFTSLHDPQVQVRGFDALQYIDHGHSPIISRTLPVVPENKNRKSLWASLARLWPSEEAHHLDDELQNG